MAQGKPLRLYLGGEGGTMTPRCGACDWNFSDRTLMKHAETPCGEESEKAGKYLPEIDDLIKQQEEASE